ncbi:hypothetical protein QEZ40_007499 [Streptomyces katrae]|uniref:DUF11 domain-containing protein n=1 Tax=Streptomyces katrae TaxID=68223 RepID=A0ABT7H5H0_9ACTN|nr:hypothetical protein [Streptomyces katrae]MDK9501127.1 hypothetical protein [Streptomyces katrae]
MITSARRAAVMVGVATVLVAGPAWAVPQQAPAAVSNSDLAVVRIDPEDTQPGGVVTVHAFVSNLGPDRTASPMTITVNLPRGTQPEGPYFPDDCQVSPNQRRVLCEFPAGLGSKRSATAQVPIRLDPDLRPGQTIRGSYSVSSPDDRNPSNNRTEFEIRVAETEPDA